MAMMHFAGETFPIAPDREEAFAWLGLRPELPCAAAFEAAWDAAVRDLKAAAVPRADVLREGNRLTAALTLGPGAEAQLAALFDRAEYVRAMLLNTLIDQLLFRMDGLLVAVLREHARKEGLFIAARTEPCVDFPLTEALVAPFPQLRLSTAGSLLPGKAMLFRLTLSAEDCRSTGLHDCAHCPKTDCSYRNAASRGGAPG